jgi:hypothetical protein
MLEKWPHEKRRSSLNKARWQKRVQQWTKSKLNKGCIAKSTKFLTEVFDQKCDQNYGQNYGRKIFNLRLGHNLAIDRVRPPTLYADFVHLDNIVTTKIIKLTPS